ncbi:hypothetical protein CVT24_001030 [Panaeolus cyanescens]|uniref:Fungal-type protein kinase domain-containing protein n=1 Tax=Panaeolus cyanescens TaxID=181874 RepID=A0A409YTN4_9AGAR|nr:hypothetical protein CVT24_001030 [Panaeolus cyanescens]
MASHSRSVTFSEPVAVVHTLPPEATPKPNVKTTPTHYSMSELTQTPATVKDAKERLMMELEGFIDYFPESRVETLLANCLTTAQCSNFLRSKRYQVYMDKKWQIPENPSAESCLYEPIHKVIQAVLDYFKLSGTRRAHNTNNKVIPADNDENIATKPDLFIAAGGPHFRRTLDDLRWSQCLSTVEVKPGDHKQGFNELLAQSAYSARQTLASQPTRSFVYNIIMTEQKAMLLCFDRVGAQHSQWMDFRETPADLVRLIYLVCNPDLKSLGVDETVVFKNDRLEFNMERDGEPVILTADPKPLFPPMSIRGRATVCWTVEDDKGDFYILKQQFVNVCRTPEHETLEDIRAHEGIDLSHIGMCVFGQKYGKVSEARGMEEVPELFHDRFLYRILLEKHGDTIDNLEGKTRLDLVVALRDAIIGHQELWNKKNVLHRDVSDKNILYKKERKGNSPLGGVLIDYDLSIYMNRKESNHKVDFRTGTKAFQSAIILLCHRDETETGEPLPNILHDHLDDLESFFWVLFYITRETVGPGEDEGLFRKNLRIREKFEENPRNAYLNKHEFLSEPGFINLQAGWGAAVKTLVVKLAEFFHQEHGKKRKEIFGDDRKARSVEDIITGSKTHYTTVLDLFNTAIKAIEEEMKTESAESQSGQGDPGSPTCQARSRSLQRAASRAKQATPTLPKSAMRRTSSKRSREAGPEPSTAAAPAVPSPDSPDPPAAKRLRSAASEPMLRDGERRMTRSASLKFKADGTVDARGDAGAGQEAGPSRGRSTGGRGGSRNSSKSSKTPRVGSRASQRLARQSGSKPA